MLRYGNLQVIHIKKTKDKLYEVSKELHSVKKALEKHLGKCTNELFDVDDKIIIYYLTNIYLKVVCSVASWCRLRWETQQREALYKTNCARCGGKYRRLFKINNQWKDIVRTMDKQKLVTTNFPNEFNQPIIIRQCSEPIEAVPKIFEALKYKHKPLKKL